MPKRNNKNIPISLVEQAILNPDFMREIDGYRCYRIEYGGPENSNPEGVIYLPPYYDADILEALLNNAKFFYTPMPTKEN